MGANPYWYIVKYRPNINQALQDLREREFCAGRYHPAVPFIQFPLNDKSQSLGPMHSSIAELMTEITEDGTHSILDIQQVADQPSFGVAAPLPDNELEELYGTTKPTRSIVEDSLRYLWNGIERGHAIYIVIYEDERPNEILFAGYSFD